MTFLDESQSPHHVVDSVVRVLGSDFSEYQLGEATVPPNGFIRIDGSIVAWRLPSRAPESFRIVGAHTDSPTLRIRPRPDINASGLAQLGVEVYGGVLLNSWLDRDLGIAGQVILRDGTSVLVRSDGAIARIPQLAIHLDRDVNDRGLILDRHSHLSPIWSSLPADGRFVDWLSMQINVAPDFIAAWSLSMFDIQPASVLGADSSMLSSGRLDNQLSCWSAARALTSAVSGTKAVKLIALFDHEEVGSVSFAGAEGTLLARTVDAIFNHYETSATQRAAVLDQSLFVSADNAHGIHPNYPERHDHANAPLVNGGVAIKINESQRYASSPRTVARILDHFEVAKVLPQIFVSRNNIPCGSTIGPAVAARLGVPTVDIGVPQLAMHSAREMCGIGDIADFQKLLDSYFTES